MDRLFPGLAVGQEHDATLKIDVLPFRVKDFTKARAGQHQQTDRGYGEQIELGPARVRLGSMLCVGLRLIDRVGQADGFSLPQGVGQSAELLVCQEALARLFWELLDAARGIMPLLDVTVLAGPGIERA